MTECRTDWTREEIRALLDLPFPDLLFEAQSVHRRFHSPSAVQLSTLLSIKTGGCPEDRGYGSQSAFAKSRLKAEKLLTTGNAGANADAALIETLGLRAMEAAEPVRVAAE